MQSSSPTISASTAKLVDIPVVNEVAKGTKKENYKSLHGCDGPFVQIHKSLRSLLKAMDPEVAGINKEVVKSGCSKQAAIVNTGFGAIFWKCWSENKTFFS